MPYDRPRILLIRPDHLGDVLLTRPAISALARALPEAALTVAVGPWGRPALGPRPEHGILICPFPGFSRAPMNPMRRYWLLLHYTRLLRRERYTMAIIARSDHWWGALLAALAGIPTRIGYDVPETRPFLTLSIPRPSGIIITHNPQRVPGRTPERVVFSPLSWRRVSGLKATLGKLMSLPGLKAGASQSADTSCPHPASAGPVPSIRPRPVVPAHLAGPVPPIRPRPEAPPPRHAAADALALAALAARCLGRNLDEGAPHPLPADAGREERAAVARLLAKAGVGDAPLVVLQPGSGSPLKAWPAERLAEIGAGLAQDLGARIAVSGSAAEWGLAQQVCDALPEGAINLAGTLQWTELEALAARSLLVVGVDSGPLHLAVAAGTPSVALFGPADPAQFGPWGDRKRHRVVTADLPCRPCRRLDWCALEPGGVGPPPCMRAISVEAVADAARAALAEGKHGPATTD